MESRFRNHYAPIIVVAEGAKPKDGEEVLQAGQTDAFGHVRLGGIGDFLAGEIEQRTGKEARTTVLGHVQRGGTPTARDRWLATRFGLHAIDAVHDGDWGSMVALRGTDIVRVPLAEATKTLKTVDPELYAEAEVYFGWARPDGCGFRLVQPAFSSGVRPSAGGDHSRRGVRMPRSRAWIIAAVLAGAAVAIGGGTALAGDATQGPGELRDRGRPKDRMQPRDRMSRSLGRR